MRKILVFLLLAGLGLLGLTIAGGGLAGREQEGAKPEIVHAPLAASGRDDRTAVPAGEFPGGPKISGPVSLRPLARASTAILREREWVDPLSRERIAIPYYPVYSIRGDDVEPVKSDGPGAPSLRWRGMHVTVYRNVNRLTRDEATRLAQDPESRKSLVRYEIDAAEGTANFRLDPTAEKEARPPVVIRLLKDVRILVVAEGPKTGGAESGDTRIRTSSVTIDEAAGTLEGDAEVVADGPGFSAKGEGLRIDKGQESLELRRNVTLDLTAPPAETSVRPAFRLAPAGGDFRPRRVTTAGPVVVTQRGAAAGMESGEAGYEAVLTDRVRVEATDDSVLTAHQVVLDLAPRAPEGKSADGKPVARPQKAAARDAGLASQSEKFQLTKMVASGDVRVSGTQRELAKEARGAARPKKRDGGATLEKSVTLDTDRMTVHFSGRDDGTALCEGMTTLRYTGALALPGGGRNARAGLVVASCRDRLSYGPPSDAVAKSLGCDFVADLVGSVRLEGSETSGATPERLEADRVRLFLRDDRVKAVPTKTASVATPAANDEPASERPPLMAFEATGGDVRILGPTVSGRAREIKAYDLDAVDGWGWRLHMAGPDAMLEIADPADAESKPKRRDAPTKPAAGAGEASRTQLEWRLDRMDATEAVRGSFATPGEDVPVTFEGDTLSYRHVEGGELRARDHRRAVLSYAGEKGHDSSIEAPLVGFRLGDGVTRVWTKGEPGVPSHAVVFTGAALAAHPAKKVGRMTIALRGDSFLDAVASRPAAGRRAITVLARDGASVERRLDATALVRIAAASIEGLLVEDVKPPAAKARRAAEIADGASAGARSKSSNAKNKGAAGLEKKLDEPTRWTLDSDSLVFEVASDGAGFAAGPREPSAAAAKGSAGMDALRLLEARGRVTAKSDATASAGAQRFEGELLVIRADGGIHRGHLEGPAGSHAVVAAEADDLPQRIHSPTVDFELDGPSLQSARFAAPVAAVLHSRGGQAFGPAAKPAGDARKGAARDAKGSGVERIVLKSAAGPLVIDASGRVTVEGTEAAPVSVVRTVRAAGASQFGNEIRLAAPRLELHTTGVLGSRELDVDRFVAEGRSTWVEAAAANGGVAHASGDRLAFARATNRLELTGKDGVRIAQPGFEGRGRQFWIDRTTGEFGFLGSDMTLEAPK